MSFPSVTICNLNPIKKSSLGLDEALQAILEDPEKKKRRRKRYAGDLDLDLFFR